MLFLMLAVAVQGACPPSIAPTLEVRVDGFKQRQGRLRIRVYHSADTFLKRGAKLIGAKLTVPATGAAIVCLPLKQSGRYAVVVRHDLNENGRSDRADGGGASRNPRVTLWQIKPAFDDVAVDVNRGVVRVAITLQYLTGGSIRPVVPAS